MRTLERIDTNAGRVRLAGRDDDRRRVRSLLDDPMPGGGALVLLGEAGMGKTALLTEVAGSFAADGARTLFAAGVQFESDVSYAALNQLLFDAHDAFDRLDEVHRAALRTALGFSGGPAPSRILVSNAVLLLVRAIAAERPLLLIVDDLHWVDPASAKVLGFVSRRLGGSGVRFLGAARTGSTGCSEVGALPQYRLPPLAERAAYDLLVERFPTLAPSVRRRVVAEAAGNPLALLELPDALTGAQRRATVQLPVVLPLTDRLAALYADRVRDLPGDCRWTLLLGALGGRDAVRVVGCDYLEMLAPAEREHLVSIAADGREFTFRNSLIRAAVVSVATTADRRRAHHALATALSAHPERRAWHLGEATAEPDENVAGLLERAAQLRHARGDSQGAVAALARAAELSPEPERRARRLALAAYLGADAAGEIDIAERFAELASAVEAGDHGYDAGDRALTEAGQHRESDPTYGARMGAMGFVLDSGEAAREDLWRVARAGTAPLRRRITSLAALGSDLFHTGQWDALKEVTDEGAALCEQHGFMFIRWHFQHQRAMLAAVRGEDPSGAEELIRWAAARGARGVELYGRQVRALRHNGVRDHAAAYREATMIAAAGTFPRFVPQALAVAFDMVEAATHTGRAEAAAAHATAMGDLPVCRLSSRLALLSAGAAGLVADDAAVRPAFEAALATPDAEKWPFDRARVRLAYGERLRRMRATQAARDQLRAAADIFRELGSPGWLERADSEIRATGLTRPRNAPQRFTTLTPKEREIAELAASGMSNKEIGERLFLSHRTIGSHLYQIFPKLGLTSRAGLRDALTELSQR